MKEAFVFAAFWVVGLTVLACWLVTQIHYRIGSTHVKILLFGLTLRRISLGDIKHVSKRKPKQTSAEYWCSTFKTNHRMLTILRNSGLRRALVITPRNRYVFLSDLQNAIKRVKPESDLRDIIEAEGEQTSVPP